MPSYRPVTDVWILARPKVAYYGAYLNGFLHRARELLGVHIDDAILHVCGGKSKEYPLRGFGPNDKTVDLDPNLKPDYLMDVCKDLPTYPGGWPAMLADPPYTEADAEHYAPGKDVFPNANKLLRLMLERVRVGGRVGMIHYLWPRPPKKIKKIVGGEEVDCTVRLVAAVGVLAGYANRIRCYSVFEVEKPPVVAKAVSVDQVKPDVFVVS